MLILQTSASAEVCFLMGEKTMEDRKRRVAARRELLHLGTKEQKLREAAGKGGSGGWKAGVEKRIPPKVYEGLVSAFSTGFSLVFRQGRRLIELTYDKKGLRQQHQQRDQAVRQGSGRQELRQMQEVSRRRNGVNMTATTAEGIALGIFGVGLPDVVLFLSTLLKGIYETALNYGFEYESPEEQYWILAMMGTALARGKDWERGDREVERLMAERVKVSEEMLKGRIQKTASVFAMDMLVLKFIQGMPVVGLIGGAANPVYYRKVMDYVEVKYKKRYLLKQLREETL